MDNRVVFLRFLHPPQIFAGLISIVVLCCVAGCGKSEKPPVTPAITPTTAPPDARRARQHVLAVHWIGKNRLTQDTNAAYQMEIWRMPESVNLETQTLDKLAKALPELLGVPSAGDTNQWTGVVRPLLDDLVQTESFSEFRTPADRPPEFALAVRLAADRASTWLTNVGMLKQLLSDSKSNLDQSASGIQFVLAGDWAILGVGGNEEGAFAEFVKRFSTTDLPEANTTNHWIEVNADLSRLVRSNSAFSSENLPLVHLVISGSGKDVRSRAELTYPNPMDLHLEQWNFPTNLIKDPLISFSALRGLAEAIEKSSIWRDLKEDAAPNQIYSWGLEGIPLQTYLAAMWPDASNSFYHLSEEFMQAANPYLASNRLGVVNRVAESNGVVWMDTPFFAPFMRHAFDPAGENVFGGFFPLGTASRPVPVDLLHQVNSRTNLVFYSWEITESRIRTWTYLGQLLRMICGKAQLNLGCTGMAWMQAVSAKLGNAVTVIELADQRRLSVSRTSNCGFTGLELHALIDWLEAPNFPYGLYTFSAPAPARPTRRGKLLPAVSLPPTNEPHYQPKANP